MEDDISLGNSYPFIIHIMATVAREFDISVPELLVGSRASKVFLPRIAAMYCARALTRYSLPDLGAMFGGRSHTTVLRSVRRCRHLMERDGAWSDRIAQLVARLRDRADGQRRTSWSGSAAVTPNAPFYAARSVSRPQR